MGVHAGPARPAQGAVAGPRAGTVVPPPLGPGHAPALHWPAVARTLAAHPELWWTALRQLARLAPRGWWRRPPFLPRPDPAWLAFRRQTMYGRGDHPVQAADLVGWLSWCRQAGPARGAVARRLKAGAGSPPGVA